MKRALVLPAIRMRHLRDSRWSVFRARLEAVRITADGGLPRNAIFCLSVITR